MRLSEVLKGVECTLPQGFDPEVTGVSTNTQTLKPGELFVALRGYQTDGHKYIPNAWAAGACAVVAQEGEGTILVPDSRAALAVIAANWYGHPAESLVAVGVTGTNGKTTTTTLLWGLLSEVLGAKVGLIGTNENRIGSQILNTERTTPDILELQALLRQMVDAGCTHVVMEVSSHALCLHRVDGISFALGAFSNLTQDHLDFHKTMENYREAKGKLFCHSALGIINSDDEAGKYYVQNGKIPVQTYAILDQNADFLARDVRLTSEGVSFVVLHKSGGQGESLPADRADPSGQTPASADRADRSERVTVKLGIPGQFSVYNALCVLACAHALGIPLKRGAEYLSAAHGVKGRMEVVPQPGPGTVVIDYSHTPDALENALIALRGNTRGRLICLFGCGGDRDRTKRPIMGGIAARLADLCVVTSDNPRSEEPEAIIEEILAGMAGSSTPMLVEPDRPAAIGKALAMLEEGDVLLLAGKGHETYQEVKGEKRHMDEREIVRDFFREKP